MKLLMALCCTCLTGLLLAGCAANAPYRSAMPDGSPICDGAHAAGQDPAWQRLDWGALAGDEVPAKPVHLGFVEFDDQGALHCPDAKRAVMARVQALADEGPLLIVVFAHGWKHNARADDGNVTSFTDLLRRIALEDERACAASAMCSRRQVVGVYLGWRGLTTSIEPFNTLSFWTRKSRAHRIGTDGATEVLVDLKKIDAQSEHKEYRQASRLVLTGHSFGGALLFTATQQLLMRDTAFLNGGSIARNTADLIVLVNPAFEASRFAALQRRASRIDHSRTQRPILAVFTSANDVATKVAFPLGRSVSSVFQSHVSGRQREENRTALGHYAPFLTHRLRLDAPSSAQDSARYAAYGCDWQRYQQGKPTWELGGMTLERAADVQGTSQQRNPYYNVQVDAGIIENHSAIWGEQFTQFLYRFMAVQSWRERSSCNFIGTNNAPGAAALPG